MIALNPNDRYDAAFIEIFHVERKQLTECFQMGNIEDWDSLNHMLLIERLERDFSIRIGAEDIFSLTSYHAGKEILAKYRVFHENPD